MAVSYNLCKLIETLIKQETFMTMLNEVLKIYKIKTMMISADKKQEEIKELVAVCKTTSVFFS